MNDDKSEDYHYTKHLSEFLFPFWSHELLLLWFLEFIAELLKAKKWILPQFLLQLQPIWFLRRTCIRFSFLWLASCSSILKVSPENSWKRLDIVLHVKGFWSSTEDPLAWRVGWSPWYQRVARIPILNWVGEFSWKVGNSPKIREREILIGAEVYVLWAEDTCFDLENRVEVYVMVYVQNECKILFCTGQLMGGWIQAIIPLLMQLKMSDVSTES